MSLPAHYQAFLDAPRMPSPMWAWLPASEEVPSATAAIGALTARFGAGLSMEMVSPPKVPDAAWEISCKLAGGRDFSVWSQRSEKVEALHLNRAGVGGRGIAKCEPGDPHRPAVGLEEGERERDAEADDAAEVGDDVQEAEQEAARLALTRLDMEQ